MRIPRRLRVFVLRPVLLMLLVLSAVVGWSWWTGNFGTIVPGRAYRSGQMFADDLAGAIREHGIRTVINLRGCNPDQGWYRDERAATLAAGATQVDLSMASDQWISRSQARALIEVLDTCEYPILVHCEWGAERTGLVSALVRLLRPGSTLADARDQFALRHMFLPIKDGLVMRGHINHYASWLRSRGLDHSPEQVRRWLLSEYRPGSPSREWWPYDPYPLVVVARPDGVGSGRWAGGSGEKTEGGGQTPEGRGQMPEGGGQTAEGRGHVTR